MYNLQLDIHLRIPKVNGYAYSHPSYGGGYPQNHLSERLEQAAMIGNPDRIPYN